MDTLAELCFPYLQVEELHKAVLAVLERHHRLPDHVIVDLARMMQSGHVEKVPLSLRRQIWQLDPPRFNEEIKPLIEKVAAEVVSAQNVPTAITNIISDIGQSVKLYDQLLRLLRRGFADSGRIPEMRTSTPTHSFTHTLTYPLAHSLTHAIR